MCNCGAMGVVFLLSCKELHAFGVVHIFYCIRFLERLKNFY